MESGTVTTPQTKALLAFQRNLESVLHMLALTGRELAVVTGALTRMKTFAGKPRDLTQKTAAAKLRRSLERSVKRAETGLDRVATARRWEVVMLVTCVEAYLEDVLGAAASVDPELMSRSEQRALYADVTTAISLDELANQMRARWARGWLSDGGPTHWISRLQKMGARGYPDDLAPRLERIWGIRHVIVHAAGIATSDFVKRHPGVVAAAGDRVRIVGRDLGSFVRAVDHFVEPTDRFFLRRYPSLLTAGSTTPAE